MLFCKHVSPLYWRATSHMGEAPPLEEDEYAKFYEIDEPVIKFEEGLNEIQHI